MGFRMKKKLAFQFGFQNDARIWICFIHDVLGFINFFFLVSKIES